MCSFFAKKKKKEKKIFVQIKHINLSVFVQKSSNPTKVFLIPAQKMIKLDPIKA